ncbi:protein HEADING DATE REPRESSOR 1-like [Impatiens glandulifera]|uniref:protein HEADING DATE REPRESSOR 1-like n=1 Tax=Impatiens glandulifera TaxID=253017 RepID=UPI001FB0F223|nr:protein HEADING DATE REPRESSOR 1-like [Impatiens glandulifera]
MENPKAKIGNGVLTGFSPISSTPVFWKSRRRSAGSRQNMEIVKKVDEEKKEEDSTMAVELSEKRKALFEPLEPNINGKRLLSSNNNYENLLIPPPDFETTSYPRGWLIGKKRKLVNVDVVESMRRIAVQEMNRKDREIDGLNEQLEEDAKCVEHLQVQLLEERNKRSHVERENVRLQSQIDMLISLVQENDDEEP